MGPLMTQNPPIKKISKSVTSIGDIATLLALMFKYSCESSDLVVFNQSTVHKNIELEQGTILDNMVSMRTLANLPPVGKQNSRDVFNEILNNHEHFDNLIVLSGTKPNLPGENNNSNDVIADKEYMMKFLRKYRALINEKLLFVNVNLVPSQCGLAEGGCFDHENDVNICGYSDSILRFVAEKGNQGQLMHIENIDRSFDLPTLNSNESQSE